MTNVEPNNQAAFQGRELKLRWYQARLGFWQTIWGTAISGGVAIAIPAGVDAYKAREERRLKEQELQGQILDSHQQYISNFLNTALNQAIELRIRFSEYFSHVSDSRHKEGWEKFRHGLVERRNNVRDLIHAHETQADKLRVKRNALTVDEQTDLARLERELSWSYAELGYVRKDTNVSAPNIVQGSEYGKDFNGSLRPLSPEVLSQILGAPSTTKNTGASSCNAIDGPKLKKFLVEYSTRTGVKINLVKPAADSLSRIITKMTRAEPELAKTISWVARNCATYNSESNAFDISAWQVSVSLGGINVTGTLSGVSGIMSMFFPSVEKEDPDKLLRLERIATYFREERWIWGGGERVFKRPNYFVVSADAFEEWMQKGEFN